MTYSYFFILLMSKQTQKDCLLSKVEELEQESLYSFLTFSKCQPLNKQVLYSLDIDLPS